MAQPPCWPATLSVRSVTEATTAVSQVSLTCRDPALRATTASQVSILPHPAIITLVLEVSCYESLARIFIR